MYSGWNRAVAELFEPLEIAGAFPVMGSTRSSRDFVVGVMQGFGKVSLLRRLVDMSERGIVDVTRDGDDFQVRISKDVRAQFADSMEADRFRAAEETTPSSSHG